MMVLRGLEAYGYQGLARRIALNNLKVMAQVFRTTGTIWENYAPEGARPGRPAKPNFVGWSGLGPIDWFLEFAIGLRPDALTNTLSWHLYSREREGCDRYRFNGHVVSLLARPRTGQPDAYTITVKSDGAFLLKLKMNTHQKVVNIKAGKQTIVL